MSDDIREAISMAYRIRKALERDEVVFEEFQMSDDIRTTLEQHRKALIQLIPHHHKEHTND